MDLEPGLLAGEVDRYADPRAPDRGRRRLAQNALARSRVGHLVADPLARAGQPVARAFDLTLRPAAVLPVADQRQSGRCWIFAFTALVRRCMVSHYPGLDPSFQLSQKFVQVHDRVEKCNALLEAYACLALERGGGGGSPTAGRGPDLEVLALRDNYTGDGGTWAFFVGVVLKYGLVPQDDYPENLQSGSTGDLRALLGRHLHSQYAAAADHARRGRAEFVRWKRRVLRGCLRAALAFWGAPPRMVAWRGKQYTPLAFYHRIVRPAVDLEAFVVLISDPRNPYRRWYSVELSHNVLPRDGGNTNLRRLPTQMYYNVPGREFAALIRRSLRQNRAVPFAADVQMFMRGDSSRMDLDLHYEDILDFDAVGDRRDLYTNLVSGPNHAMLIVGAQAGRGPSRSYQVENSWGVQNAAHPYLTMTDGWLQHFGGEIVVHRDVASPAPPARAQDITFYPFWDIFGTLA